MRDAHVVWGGFDECGRKGQAAGGASTNEKETLMTQQVRQTETSGKVKAVSYLHVIAPLMADFPP
jgi:hypothetical protein